MPKQELKLSTKKSIHPPIVIRIDDKAYENNPLSRIMFEELKKYEKAALGGDIEALYKQVQLIYSVPMEELNKLDVRDVKTLLEFTMTKTFGLKTEGGQEKEEKKE